jgi:uncharacterized protein YukJ
MPLASYGVCVGTLLHLDPSEQGKWYHGVFTLLDDDGQPYECTVDLESKREDEVQYLVLDNLSADLFQPIIDLSTGYQPLQSNPTSGALDYIRSPFLNSQGVQAWTTTTGQKAVNVLIAQITDTEVSKLFVFGQPFTEGLGLHNVHMNQGDPPLSPDGLDHQADDGIWQDGGTILQYADGSLHAFLSKFPSQSMSTNDQGLPV